MPPEPFVFTVEPGSRVTLNTYNPRYKAGLKRAEADTHFEQLTLELEQLQEMMYAAGTHSLLVIFQGMDTSGKDGVVRKVFSQITPTACKVTAFKAPTAEELAHDFLWRIHQATPARGEIAIFNRSHYEDVLIVRVRNLVPKKTWQQRYDLINDFERLLVTHNTLVIKFFLHISKEEQAERLYEREQEIIKAWKLNPQDWTERQYWDQYQQAYEDALSRCSTDYAPWYVVPADRKWYRNYAVVTTLVDTLRPYREGWMHQLKALHRDRIAELETLREHQQIATRKSKEHTDNH